MRALHAMILLLGALAVLMTGAAPGAALAEASSAPPCHEAAAHHGGAETPAPAPDKPMKAMECCVACVAAPSLLRPEPRRVAAPPPSVIAVPATLPAGERPAPEPHPPRPPLS